MDDAGEEKVKRHLKEAFGDSSDDEIELGYPKSGGDESVCGGTPIWERISEINGLWICRDFLSHGQQSSLLSSIHKEGWLSDSSGNQAMRFGDLPSWAVELSNSIREAAFFLQYLSESTNLTTCDNGKDASPFPSDLLWRQPLFDQLIMNTYQPGEGICAHVDLMRFEDGIAIISLESSCVMHFTRVENESSVNADEKIAVHLTEGSLVLMSGEARYLWKHEINRKPGFQKWKGQEIDQRKRTSITLRKLCHTA